MVNFKCPKCGRKNDDNWPLEMNNKIKCGGCQDCWEDQCDKKWWKLFDIGKGKGP